MGDLADLLRQLQEKLPQRADGGSSAVIEAGNGIDALEVAEKYSGPIHLLMTDVVMPGMNGPTLAESLVVTYPSMKVLCMSGYTGTFANFSGLVDRGMRLLQKPFSRDILLRKVREVIDSEEVTKVRSD